MNASDTWPRYATATATLLIAGLTLLLPLPGGDKARADVTPVMAPAAGQTPAAPVPTDDFQYKGYMRSGIGGSRGGTDQSCFGAPGASGKFRLGNECQTYLEATFIGKHHVSATDPAPIFSTVITVAMQTSENHDWEASSPQAYGSGMTAGQGSIDQELMTALPEIYARGENIFGSAKPWIGKRYYQRQDVHVLDYFIINNTGPGAGIEDIDVGFGKLQLAVMRNSPNVHDDGPTQTNPDIRLSDIDLHGAGNLKLIFIYGVSTAAGHHSGDKEWEPGSGEQFGFVHKFDLALGGWNRVTGQYGRALFGGDGASRANLLDDYGSPAYGVKAGDRQNLAARNRSSTGRLVEEWYSVYSAHFSSLLSVLYQKIDFGGYKDPVTGAGDPARTEIQAGIRPFYQFTDHTALAWEYGYANIQKAVATADGHYLDSTLHKVTIAPQVAAGDWWARPQLRLFATYAWWNHASKGLIGGPTYASSVDGFSTGAQFESWW